jgi:hypothetical protein
MVCPKCKDTGVIETGNDGLPGDCPPSPCDCVIGDKTLFSESLVEGGPVTGAQVKKHLLNDSTEPIDHTIQIAELPGGCGKPGHVANPPDSTEGEGSGEATS